MFRMPSVVKCSVFAVIVLGAAGCSAGHRPPVVEEGQAFRVSKCSQLQPGAPAAQARSSLGEPLNVIDNEDSETWEYFVRVREADRRKFLGLIPLPDDERRWSAKATVRLEKGIVVEVLCPDRAGR